MGQIQAAVVLGQAVHMLLLGTLTQVRGTSRSHLSVFFCATVLLGEFFCNTATYHRITEL